MIARYGAGLRHTQFNVHSILISRQYRSRHRKWLSYIAVFRKEIRSSRGSALLHTDTYGYKENYVLQGDLIIVLRVVRL